MPGIFDEALKNIAKEGINSPVQSSVTNNETNTDSWLIKAGSLREAFVINKHQTLDEMLIEYVQRGSKLDKETAHIVASYLEKKAKPELAKLMDLLEHSHNCVESLHLSQDFNYLEHSFSPECQAAMSWLEGVFSRDPSKSRKYQLSSLFGEHLEFNNLHALQHCLKGITTKDLKNNELGIVVELEQALGQLLATVTQLDAHLFSARFEMKDGEIFSHPK